MASRGWELEERPGVRLFLLGGFRAMRDGQEVRGSAWGRPQAGTLIKLLAVGPMHSLHREQLAELLWPDGDPDVAPRNLRKLLYYVRHALDPEPGPEAGSACLRITGESIGLEHENVWIDVDAFEQAAACALATRQIDHLEAAAAIYGGSLLPEDRYESWAEERRDELAGRYIDLLLGFAAALAAQGRDEDAIGRLVEVLSLDAAQEDAHREPTISRELGDRARAILRRLGAGQAAEQMETRLSSLQASARGAHA